MQHYNILKKQPKKNISKMNLQIYIMNNDEKMS